MTAETTHSIRLDADLTARIDQAVETTRLKKVDVLRLSIERGLDTLVAQLTSPPTTEEQ